MSSLPVTERSNPLTANIDISLPEDIVSLLQHCDREIFHGWDNQTEGQKDLDQLKGLLDGRTIRLVEKIAGEVANLLRKPSDNLIVLSGCGTSGRLAFLTARTFNKWLRELDMPECFRYVIAGGDKALFTSQEAPEDDPVLGAKKLQEVCAGKKKVLYIGITCGLSASFVAGQLDFCMDNLDTYIPVLMGFNPVDLAKNLPIENWSKTILEVCKRLENLQKTKNCCIINPIIGPEPITGSSRMKGGTATKILLDVMFAQGFSLFKEKQLRNTEQFLETYLTVNEAIGHCRQYIGAVINLAGQCLRKHGHIYYIGADSLGILAMIDASECPPTFGTSLDGVRGFLIGGFDELRNQEGNISVLGRHFSIAVDDFQSTILPNLQNSDIVIFINHGSAMNTSLLPLLATVQNGPAESAVIHIMNSEQSGQEKMKEVPKTTNKITVQLPWIQIQELFGPEHLDLSFKLFAEIATKWVCNAVTTGAHIMQGKVYQNYMVDLRVSNNKLFHRAVRIVETFSGCNKEDAQEYLLKSIYGTDVLTGQQTTANVSQHILQATSQEKVVPTALVCAILKCSLLEAQKHLAEEPVIRSAITSCLEKKNVE
ncbi:glucokinase regulatory protein [Lingula anatina]|uniref:Glucokinase regulatory protein n=1 Tax=Lingula anatina TaxID=7574 RepID=A0A1S3JA66_LINAN|nr:glucokinase regulatory protein [Lingula anatina]XP_013406773.1 glucokinase regulatory protein [Lingula anatina]XP_013406774.1 glucokinase regulatory protein [Lingula anatina]XP_023933507.1 glucokinase regulatory protein [Lingula anatina]|eukprot:XP_013406772.1 glucokinase regulatory protein [Lingula anatina]